MTAASVILYAASFACLVLAVHPFATYPLALRVLAALRPRPLCPAAGVAVPSLAVCVCAYNEEKVIGGRVRNILSMRETIQDLRIMIYVDGASDGTAGIVRGFGDAIEAVISTQRLGKTHGMNTLVSMTTADILVFSDANVVFAPDALIRLIAPFSDPEVGCVCGHLHYAAGAGGAAQTGSLYWRLEEYIKAMESSTGSVMGADGSIFAVRRALFTPSPPHLIDDMHLSLSILCRGARLVRAADAIAYEPVVSTSQEEFRRKVRIACQAFNVHRALRPALRRLGVVDQFKYVSHKLLRWLSIFSLASAVLLFEAASAMAGAWQLIALSAAFGAIAALTIAGARRGPASKVREILLALVATGLGVLQSLRGQHFQTWTPPASARAISAAQGNGG